MPVGGYRKTIIIYIFFNFCENCKIITLHLNQIIIDPVLLFKLSESLNRLLNQLHLQYLFILEWNRNEIWDLC